MSDTPMRKLLQGLAEIEDHDDAFLVAATINLYHEALRRKGGAHRCVIGPEDVRCMFTIGHMLLTAHDLQEGPSAYAGRRAVAEAIA